MDLAARYRRAEGFLPWNLRRLVRNARIEPHWYGITDSFWYRRETQAGWRFECVDAATDRREPAFDHEALAAALQEAGVTGSESERLPIEWIAAGDRPGRLRLRAGGRQFTFDAAGLTEEPVTMAGPGDLLAPDGRHAVFRREHDLWVRDIEADAVRALTTDGAENYAYGGSSGNDCQPLHRRLCPAADLPRAIWSRDSCRLISHRLDERRVEPLYLLESLPADGSRRPRLHRYPYAFAGEPNVAQTELFVFDVLTGAAVCVQRGARHGSYVHPIDREFIWWGHADRRIYWLDFERGHRSVTLCEIDPKNGEVTEILTERSETYVELNLDVARRPNVRDLEDGKRFIWYSERDGWGHLYLIDRRGAVLAQLTRGEWVVRDIVAVDEQRGEVLFTANGREPGRDPYYRKLYRVPLCGGPIELLTPEDADHDISIPPVLYSSPARRGGMGPSAASVSPSGRFLVATHSTPDTAPVTLIRDLSQAASRTLVTCDVSALESFGWRWPTPFEARAADGERLHGLLFLPSDFDPQQRYPVLESVYPGPQTIQTPKASFNVMTTRWFMYAHAAAQAELGFAVVMVDGRGTPYRSKAWHDAGYGRLQDAGGMDDRLCALRQLAAAHPYLDLDRLGVFGHSGGGYAATRAVLQYPDDYRAAYASCPVQDMQTYTADWGEKYQGPLDSGRYAAQDNARLAYRLKGRLMLVWGELDDNVHYAGTLRLVQALIDAQKDFEALPIPTANHWFAMHLGYAARRQWDFFVRWLLRQEPPADVTIADNPDASDLQRPPRPAAAWWIAEAEQGDEAPIGK